MITVNSKHLNDESIIIELASSTPYSINDIRQFIKEAGISVASAKEVINSFAFIGGIDLKKVNEMYNKLNNF